MVLKILKYPESILRKRCLSVEKISKEIVDLSDDMIETLKKEDGLGLAANQVGSQVQVFVLNTTPREDMPTPEVFINPKILDQEGAVVEEEGCLSFPELYLQITRYEKVRLHAKNLYNEDIIYESSGLLARAIQHEIDHLNGVVFIDHANKEDEQVIRDYLANLNTSVETK